MSKPYKNNNNPDKDEDFNAKMKKKISSHVRKRKNLLENVSCFDIYNEITTAVQENRKKNSESRKKFISSMLQLLTSMEEMLYENEKIGEDIHAELMEVLRVRMILRTKLSNKLNHVAEKYHSFLEDIKQVEVNIPEKQKRALEKLRGNIEKFNSSMSDLIIKEQTLKIEFLKNLSNFFNE